MESDAQWPENAYFYCSGTLAATFGASAGVFAIFFFGAVPRVKK
jgi:hypothetical protein